MGRKRSARSADFPASVAETAFLLFSAAASHTRADVHILGGGKPGEESLALTTRTRHEPEAKAAAARRHVTLLQHTERMTHDVREGCPSNPNPTRPHSWHHGRGIASHGSGSKSPNAGTRCSISAFTASI
jgi:hypothetical protein